MTATKYHHKYQAVHSYDTSTRCT